MKCFFTCFDWDSFWINVIVSTIFLIISLWISTKLIPLFTLKLIEKKRRPFVVSKISILLLELCEFFEKNAFRTTEICKENIYIYTNYQKLDKELIGSIICNITDKDIERAIDKEIIRSEYQNGIEEGLKKIKKEHDKIVQLKYKLESFINTHTLDIDTEYLTTISDVCLKIRAFEIKFNRNYNSKELFDKGLIKRHNIEGIRELRNSYKLIIQLSILLLENKNIEYTIEKRNLQQK
ncbi:hypothetical protein [Tenacibaculum piscium]|uniref:hypothetical protein n=1 Tax=Tenacibaculum piscium TaxID=1458515 RepID=UPI001EFA5C83|nr:hypothetical protein [Tenacibaculum piscium]MCG8183088.1 hypothetical protein [Tenacibaculum piscium]MCG8204728.1 hypothetical protein [Tenacibaculum piscium]